MFKIKSFIILVTIFIIFGCSKEQLPSREYPRLMTLPVDEITDTGAIFRAEVTHLGETPILDHGFVWSKDVFPALDSNPRYSGREQNNVGEFSVTINSDLQKGTTYYIKSYAITEEFTVYGNIVSFVSKGSLPPKIDSISRNIVSWGDTIYIYGENFSSYQENNYVLFDDTEGFVHQSTSEEITVLIPRLPNGSTIISVKVAGMESVFNQTINITTSMLKLTTNGLSGSYRNQTISFVCNNTGYSGLGFKYNMNDDDIWKFNPVNNNFSVINNISGNIRKLGVAFSINDIGYIGTGENNEILSGFLKFNPSNNSWTTIKSYANGTKVVYGATAFSIGEFGYVGTGIGNSETYYNDFWKYDPTSNNWTEIANLDGEPRSQAISFAIGNNAYVGLGKSSSGYALNDLWKYNSQSNTWTRMQDYPGEPSYGAIAFVINGKGYVGLGSNDSNEIWEYTPEINSWTRVFHFNGGNRYEGEVMVINQKAYILYGSNIDMSQWHTSLYEFVP